VNLKRIVTLGIITFFVLPLAGISLQNEGVLEPENANEIKLSRLLPPEKIIDVVGVTQGMILAEIGAGRGRFAVHLAVRIGVAGMLYAEDINSTSLKHLENRCEQGELFNVKTVLGEIADPKLPADELDLIFVVSSYHHFRDPVALLRNAKSALKEDGRLAIAEWLPWNEDDREGTAPEEMEAQMKAAGYRLESTESLAVEKPLNIYIFRPFEVQ
jgi:ubiquinone/menaquinone biosynthesis C-methylase UbiE